MGIELKQANILSVLKNRWLGQKYVFFDEIDSTNLALRRLAKEESVEEAYF